MIVFLQRHVINSYSPLTTEVQLCEPVSYGVPYRSLGERLVTGAGMTLTKHGCSGKPQGGTLVLNSTFSGGV